MSLAQRLARTDAISECIAAVWPLMNAVDDPGPVAFGMLAALQALKDAAQAVVAQDRPVDYTERARDAARIDHAERDADGRPADASSPAVGSIATPLGTLKVMTWRRPWSGKHGAREVWASEYHLNDENVTLAALRKAGLAARPHTRNRKTRSAEI